jgi:transposase
MLPDMSSASMFDVLVSSEVDTSVARTDERGSRTGRSTVGRPRRLTDSQVDQVLAWHAAILELKAKRSSIKTIRQLAKEFGVSTAAINGVVRRRGEYKQASPENRDRMIRERHAFLRRMRRRYD